MRLARFSQVYASKYVALAATTSRQRSWFSTSATQNVIRNIGIAAHVDAGKTTVSERMLFYSNKTMGIGEVHDGAATMDYLPQERERGITINAAAITFYWQPNARVNLIDTPGHYDFTTEVERSMRVLDGAVIVFDAVEGVEAQTETVWRQASRYDVPRIAFANKMDRDGASFEKVITTMKSRLECEVLPIHAPIGEWSEFVGMYDLVFPRKVLWEPRGGESMGREFQVEHLKELPEDVMNQRQSLFEKIADLDDDFAERFLEKDMVAAPSDNDLNLEAKRALRRITLAQAFRDGSTSPKSRPGVPLLCGAALRNTGIQLLLDAVVDYLPAPHDRPPTQYSTSPTAKNLLGFVFKVQNDPNRGPLAFVRLYKGKLRAKDQVTILPANKGQPRKERIHGLLQAEAKSYVPFDQPEAREGDVCVVAGVPSLRTGDTLGDATAPLPGLQIPPPVFSIALELESISLEPKLFEAMATMTRDDPGLVFSNDEDNGQFLLSGIGELHLEVTLDRLKREHGVHVMTSPPRVAYKEHLSQEAEAKYTLDKVVQGQTMFCKVKLSIRPHDVPDSDPIVVFAEDDETQETKQKKTKQAPSNKKKGKADPDEPLRMPTVVREAATKGILGALSRGPLSGLPVRGVIVRVEELETKEPGSMTPSEETISAVRNACTSCVFELYTMAAPKRMEPYFVVEAIVPESDLGDVLGDLTGRRRADIISVDPSSKERMLIKARVPAMELLSYAKILRGLTAGHGTFSANFDKYVVLEE